MDKEEYKIKLLEDNNRMLREIIQFINAFLGNAGNENMNDFSRNILANLISNIVELKNLNHGKS